MPGQVGVDDYSDEVPPKAPTQRIETRSTPKLVSQQHTVPSYVFGPPRPPVETLLDEAVAMCGTHHFKGLRITAAITVANQEDGKLCPAGSEGRLELDAQTIIVEQSGSIDGHAITTKPGWPASPQPELRPTGGAGGNNAGIGHDGSTGFAGFPGIDPEGSTNGYAGGPGSKIASSTPVPGLTGTTAAAGPAGLAAGPSSCMPRPI